MLKVDQAAVKSTKRPKLSHVITQYQTSNIMQKPTKQGKMKDGKQYFQQGFNAQVRSMVLTPCWNYLSLGPKWDS